MIGRSTTSPSFPALAFQVNPRIQDLSKMASEVPIASAVESKTPAEPVEMDAVLATLKSLEAADLFKVLKTVVAEAEKKAKSDAKSSGAAAKKKGSAPKGVSPPQLAKPRAWVEFVLQHALANGWESFVVHQTKKDKVTGEKVEEEIEMPGSVLHDGAHVYEGSVTEKTPAGKQLIHKDAMSLSKQYWAPKDKKGTRPELYEEFEAGYVPETVSVAETASTTGSKVVKMTAAEKAAAAEAKKAEKEAEKAAKKAEKEAEKAAKKAEKEAEKAAKKAEKEAEKAAKKAEKEAAKKPAVKAPVPAAAVKKATAAPVKAAAVPVKAAAVPVKAAAVPVKAATVAKPAPVAEEWSCPADGMIHPWSYKGKKYFRNHDNEVWEKAADGSCGDWAGVFLPAEDRIDDSVPEPEED